VVLFVLTLGIQNVECFSGPVLFDLRLELDNNGNGISEVLVDFEILMLLFNIEEILACKHYVLGDDLVRDKRTTLFEI